MRNINRVLLVIMLITALNGCSIRPSPAVTSEIATVTLAAPTLTPATPTLTPGPTSLPISANIQAGNTFPKIKLRSHPSGELEDNRIGGFAGGLTGGGWKPGEPWDYAWMVDQIVSRGLKRFRVSIDNLDAGSPDLDWSIPQYTVDPSHDTLITLLSREGVKVTYVLTFWDKDTWPGGKGANCPRFKNEAEIERYLQFAQFMVNHFKGRVQNFEIWNEPNIKVCPQWIEAVDYINLVKRAAPVIRQEYPEAKIVVGGTSYLGEADSQDYLFKILSSDIMPLVDVVSWHPMYGTSPEFDPEYYSDYRTIVQRIKDTASANGFNGMYEADELTWFTTNGQNWDGWSKRYDDVVAAKYMARGIIMHLGMDITAGIASALIFDPNWVAIPSTVRNLSTIMAGAKTTSIPIELETDAKEVVSYTFALPGGDILVALWRDGAASEDDSGVEATLVLPGLTSQHVIGIDALNGFEQQLATSNENGNLAISNLLIKDYPIIIRIVH